MRRKVYVSVKAMYCEANGLYWKSPKKAKFHTHDTFETLRYQNRVFCEQKEIVFFFKENLNNI